MSNVLRLALRLPLLLVPLAVLALADEASAGEHVIAYDRGSADPAGVVVLGAPGIAACGAGCSTLRVPARTAVAARRQGVLQFAAPAGTTIVDAQLRLRLRTRQAGVVAKVQARVAGRWIDQARVRTTQPATRTIVAGRGATAVSVALVAEAAIGRNAVRSDADNMVAVDGVQLRVRDIAPPVLAWTEDPATGEWQRGALCAGLSATDVGLGVDRLEYQVGAATAVASAPTGSRLQPRPTAFESRACVETTSLPDGAYGTTAAAVDGGDGGNRTSLPGGLVRIDNTAPTATLAAPADPEARRPDLFLAVHDQASGVERVEVEVDGFAVGASLEQGRARFQPPQPLADGLHKVAWRVTDAAGNVTAASGTFAVHDQTPPVIDQLGPEGTAAADSVVTARATDTGAGLAPDGLRIAVDGLDMTAAAELADGVLRLRAPQGWAQGEHVVRLQAVDRSGNRAQSTWSFVVPTPAPTAPVDPPVPPTTTIPDATVASGSEPALAEARIQAPARVTIRRRTAHVVVRVLVGPDPVADTAVVATDGQGRRVATGVTGPAGIAVLAIPRGRTGVLRVSALGAEAELVVAAAPRVSLRADRRRVAAGAEVALRGTAPAGAAVVVEARARGRWVAVVRLRADAEGAFATPVRLPAPGTYAVRARTGAGASEPVRLTAR